MKKVFKIKFHYYWACNGQLIRNVHYTEWAGGQLWLKPFDGRRFRIEMVKPPVGRCPHCGEKI